MKRLTEIILTVAVILVMSFITGQCYGEQVIYGCYNQKTGALRIVNSLTQCSRNETRISWNQTGGNAWSLTGNSGTDPVNNFLGTTDSQALEGRVNNIRAL